MKRIRFTAQGYEKLKEEYELLLKSRPFAVEDLKKARELGDLSENGYYKAARAKLTSVDHGLFRLKMSLKQAKIMDKSPSDRISVGSNVILTDGKKEYKYKIVGDLEANPATGKISLLSPLGKAIEGRKKDDEVEFKTPSGIIKYLIKNIQD